MNKLSLSQMEMFQGGHDCPDGTSHDVTLIHTAICIIRIIPGTGGIVGTCHPTQTFPLHTCN